MGIDWKLTPITRRGWCVQAWVIDKSLRGNITMLVDGRVCGLLPGVGQAMALPDRRLTEAVERAVDLPRGCRVGRF